MPRLYKASQARHNPLNSSVLGMLEEMMNAVALIFPGRRFFTTLSKRITIIVLSAALYQPDAD
jgi:hypothetical protein